MNSDKIAAIKAFIQEVNLDVQDYQALLKVLKAQHTMLTKRDSERLEQTAAQYQKFLAKLEDRAAKRSQLLMRIGVSSDAKGVEKLIEALPDSIAKPLTQNWIKLQESVSECQAQNERNGHLLSMQQSILTELTQSSSESQIYAPE
ncbi:flagellar export chaperone FlgN [Vibrio astriarenae]|uniref:flagellar export chaperone FlgN n=1 Tax=Vibrio astriarenae TaxID=1481923 RepID=UPI0026C0AB35